MLLSILGLSSYRWDSPEAISKIVRACAKKYELDEKLVAAIIYQESKGNTHAFREEEEWYERHLADKTREQLSGYVPRGLPSLHDEKKARSVSYGLMQILGESARSILGFKGRWLHQLHDPELNIELGCNYFKQLLDAKKGNVREALLRYNGGGNAQYPTEVLNHIKTGAYKQILRV